MICLKVFMVVFLLNNMFIDVKSKIIIDNDAGADDALGIFLTLLYEKYYKGPELIGLTTVKGNTAEDIVSTNNQRILKVAKRQDIPIYRGSKSSLVITTSAKQYFGVDGLGDVVDKEGRKNLVPPQKENAFDALIKQSKIHKGNLTVVTTGTLTNIALTLKLDPDFMKRLKHLYIGAGNIHDENYKGPEFNALMDVEAYHIVAQYATPDKVTVLPLSTIETMLNLSREWRQEVLGTINTDMIKALNLYERVSLNQTDRWSNLDPAVIAVVLSPDMVEEYKYSNNSIILCGEKRGLNTNKFVEDMQEANIRLISKIKVEAYKQFLLDVFTAELK